MRGLTELTHVEPTHRLAALTLLASAFVALSIFNRNTLAIGIALFLLIACCRGMVTIEASAITRCSFSIEVVGRSEDEELRVRVRIENRSLAIIPFAEISIEHSPHLRLVKGSKVVLATIPPRSSIVVELSFDPRVGKHWIGPVTIVVRDPLGLFRSQPIKVNVVKEVMITPRVSEAQLRRILVKTRSSGVVRSREPGTGVEFFSVREYRPGDDLRRVDWKHFAATSRLVVKELERETFQSVAFVIDATSPTLLGPRKSTPLEHVLRIVSSLSLYLSRRGDLQMVLVYSKRGVTCSRLVRGRSAFKEVLGVLSSIELDTEETSEEDRCRALSEAVKKLVSALPRERNVVFMFTVSGGDRYLDALVKAITTISSLGNVVYVVLPLATLYQEQDLPKWARLVFRVKAYEALKREESFARKLRSKGVKVVVSLPQYIPMTIASIIERMAA